MSVFDDIKTVLDEINQKLGPNAGDKASVLNRQPKEKKEEDVLKNRNSELTRAIRDAFNNIPILNRLVNALTGLTPILKTTFAGGALVTTVKNLSKNQAINQAMWNILGTTKKDIWVGYPQAQKTVEEADKLKNKPLPNFGGPWNTLLHNSLIGIRNYFRSDFVGTLISNIRSGIQNIPSWTYKNPNAKGLGFGMQPLGNIGSMTAGMGAFSPMQLLTVPSIIVGTGVALLALTKKIADAQRNIAQYSGQLSYAFAMSDVRTIFRDMRSAFSRQESVSKFLSAWSDLADKWRPLEDEIVNGLMNLGVGLAKLTTKLLEILDKIGGNKVIAEIAGGLPHLGPAPYVELRTDYMGQLQDYRNQLDFSSNQILKMHDKEKLGKWIEMMKADKVKAEKELNNTKAEEAFTGEPWFGPSRTSIEENHVEGLGYQIKYLEAVKKKWDAGQMVDPHPMGNVNAPAHKADNAVVDAMGKVKEAASAIIKNYTKEGAMGAAEFMMQAASWNYDADKTRPAEHNHALWDTAVRIKRHGG